MSWPLLSESGVWAGLDSFWAFFSINQSKLVLQFLRSPFPYFISLTFQAIFFLSDKMLNHLLMHLPAVLINHQSISSVFYGFTITFSYSDVFYRKRTIALLIRVIVWYHNLVKIADQSRRVIRDETNENLKVRDLAWSHGWKGPNKDWTHNSSKMCLRVECASDSNTVGALEGNITICFKK